MGERDLDQCLEYHVERLRSEMRKELPNEKEIAEAFLTQLDEHAESKLAELRAHNLNECRQLASNTLTQLF